MDANLQLRTFDKYLEFKNGTSNKFYKVEVREVSENDVQLTIRYGRIGTNGRSDTTHFGSWDYCMMCANERVEEKLDKGYRLVSDLEALASAFEEPEERKQNGLPPVDDPIPVWHTGNAALAAKLDKWANNFLRKLNLIRTSFYGLTESQYRKQVESLFDQAYRGAKKLHKDYIAVVNADPRTVSGIKLFYNGLREKSGTNSWVIPQMDSWSFS